MAITAQQVKDLREQTGAGMMDCKKALTETNGDFEAATKLLKEKGLAAAVYTQLSDVEDEINGLVTYDRSVVKIEPERMRQITDLS